jgi:hypothetical protein
MEHNIELSETIDLLIQHWEKQSISISPNSRSEITEFETSKNIKLPEDFVEFYLRVNGMEFPVEKDEEGFCFFSVQQIKTIRERFNIKWYQKYLAGVGTKNKILIFVDYMDSSWWYGVEIDSTRNDYTIGIIPDKEKFKPITKSLAEFLRLYMDDSEILYDYE